MNSNHKVPKPTTKKINQLIFGTLKRVSHSDVSRAFRVNMHQSWEIVETVIPYARYVSDMGEGLRG